MLSPVRRVLLVIAAASASCVDPTTLVGFECDADGRCRLADGGSSATGGGRATGGGTATGGGSGGGLMGGGSGGGTGGGAFACDPSSCTGCCDSTGACRSGDQPDTCGQGGGSCVVCGAGNRCSVGVCQPLAANGGTCGTGSDCASGACVAGLCCNSACTGSCETCAAVGSEGRCTPLAEASMVSACGAYACDGISGACLTTCTTSRHCTIGRFCDNGTCALLKTPGTSCGSSTECASGFCADGVCCNGACSGSCDRCNLSASNGTCSPAPASDPGSPACGGAVVCNGTLADCPITCASGCPSNTYCSGTYCSAKKTNGVTCSAPTECTSNNCVDGVCCDTGCAGACDACSVAQGASADGTCTLLGPTRICRAAATTCDQEERCTGTSAACPGNAFTGAGVGCGTTTFSGWSGCDAGTGCATNGVQTRTRTEQLCNGTNATCTASNATESQGCMRPTEGVSCGTTTYGTWSTCTYAATCTTSGSRTRVRTDPVCASGTCSAVQTTETDTAGCTRTTDNVSCGSASYGTWSACSFGTTCAETGSRSRARTDPVCQTGACGSTMATETDTSMCTRTTGGQSCGTTNTGAWGSCSYGATCATSGSRTRAVTTYSCGSGACNSSMTTETDTSACGRTTSGTSCGTTQYGAWSACSFGATCSNSGSRTRSVTTYACDGAASCQPSMSTETDTAGCGRNTNGTSCGTTTYGSYTACSYGGACSDSGSRTRSVTTLTCSSGSCASSPGSETDTAGCARNTTGATCASTSCGNCICPACERTCTVYTCAGGACSGSPDSLFCSCGGGCAIKAPGPRE